MNVEGKHTLDLPIDLVWKHILDRSVLEEVTPGVKELIELEPHRYEAKSSIKLGPVKGSFKGNLLVHDIKDHESFVLTLEQDSAIGSANADIVVHLKGNGGQTNVEYGGEAKLTGVIGRLGQRVLGGVVRTLAKQFFDDFEKKVKSE